MMTSRAVATIFSNTYATDKNGDIVQVGTTTYGYDALRRVDAENTPSATSYTYDATDNRLTRVQGTTSTVPATSNKVSAVGASAYTYDLAGNITGDGTNTYAWDNAGQLSTVKLGATTLGTYTYDWQHKRSKKVAGATTTLYVYGPNGLLYGEYTTTGALVREYVYLDDQPLAQVTAGSPETLAYLHTDHLNTPRYATNAAGTQVWAWAPDAFGTSTPTGTATVNLRFPGQYFDSESGLHYNWNRYYKPGIGRYISSDPIGVAGGLNTFSYVGQSPVMYGDPEGLIVPLLATAWGRTPKNSENIALSCAQTCAAEWWYDMNKPLHSVPALGAISIPKKSLGLKVVGSASKYTNPISYMGHLLENEPMLPFPVLGTRRVCSVLGRASPYMAGLYDGSALATCTSTCISEGGL